MGLAMFLVVLVLLAGWGVVDTHHRLVALRNRYQTAYVQIDMQLQRRYDLISKLVETARGCMKREQEILEAVMVARNQAMQANSQAARHPGDSQAMQQLENAEAALTGTLRRLRVISETYSDSKADRTLTQWKKELASLEKRIAFARQAFNDAVTLYNTNRNSFPSNLVAGALNFRTAHLLEEVAPELRFTAIDHEQSLQR